MKDHFSLSLCQPLDKGKGLCYLKKKKKQLNLWVRHGILRISSYPRTKIVSWEVSMRCWLLRIPSSWTSGWSSSLHLLHRSGLLLGIPVDFFYMWLVVPSLCSFLHSSSWHTSLYLLFHLNCVHLSRCHLSCSPPTPDPTWAPKGCG